MTADWAPGACLLTPHGIAVLHSFDMQRDLVFTNRGAFDTCEDELVVLDRPDFGDPEALEAWLQAGPQPYPERRVAQRMSRRCRCACGHCYVEIMVRGGLVNRSHFQDTGCVCNELRGEGACSCC